MENKKELNDNKLIPAIVICVHNALNDVKKCVKSIYSNTLIEFNLILINDGSDKETTDYLRKISNENSNVNLLENNSALGYTKSANIGLKSSTSEYSILMNSDVIVTRGWLSQLVQCANSNSSIGLVGPISNAASWQSVPDRFDSNGDWAINEIPADINLNQYSDIVKRIATKKYPEVQLLNGVCTLIKRAVFDSIGYLDEINFPRGYGEENDFCLRANDAGFNLVIDESTYIFHAKSKSFGHDTRRSLSKAGNEILVSKYGNERLQVATEKLRNNKILKRIRTELKKELIDLRFKNNLDLENLSSVIFLLPVAGVAGGIHSVFQEVTGMRLLNVDAKIATWESNKEAYYNAYPNIQSLDDHFFFYNDFEELMHYCAKVDVVVATINHSVFLLKRIFDRNPNILPAYYVQDYEPFFFEEGSEDWKVAHDSYNYIPEALLMAKTNWLCETVEQLHNKKVEKVSPSLDPQVYYPHISFNENKDKINVVAMVRPTTPRRGAERTMRVLKRIKERYADNVQINIFGTPEEVFNNFELERDFEYTNWEIINRERVALLLRESEIFIDLSIYQAFGRTGLEAMACGCAVVLPERGGASEYAVHEHNSLLVNTSEDNVCFNALEKLIIDSSLRDKFINNAINDSAHYSIRRAALSELLLFKKYLQNRKQNNKQRLDVSVADRFYSEDGHFSYDLVSIIVVLEKKSKLSKNSIESIVSSLRNNDELIIVNNSSSSNLEYLNKYSNNESIQILTPTEEISKESSYELGINNSKNPFIGFVDQNAIIPKNLFKKLIAFSDKKNIAAVAPLINMENSFQHIDFFENNKRKFPEVDLLNEELEKHKNSRLNICKTLSLNCLVVRREAYNRTGGFNSFNNFDFVELDFMWRLKRNGASLGVALNTYCYLSNSNNFPISNQQSIVEDKKKLFGYLSEFYDNESMLSPQQIWGIDNLHFKSTNIERDENYKDNFKSNDEDSASIVILTYNSSKTIMKCLLSVNTHKRVNDEIIIVDNNSEDDTEQIVISFIGGKENYKFIRNEDNIGFSAGTNVGINQATNPFVILLNPDTVVTANWVRQLIEHFDSNEIGAVGPVSNYVAGMQKMELHLEQDPSNDKTIDEVAEIYYQNNQKKSVETKLLIGFCIALRKDILDRIGNLDESLFLGNDDLELSWRLRENGYQLKIATDTFIYHEGQQSFNTKPSEVTSKLVQESTNALYKKLLDYYAPKEVPTSEELWGMKWFTPSENLMKKRESKISTSIVVLTHNQLQYTKEFVESVKKFTSGYKLIIVDNNSNDGTVEYLNKISKQESFVSIIINKTNEGFPKAVNQALKIADTDYILLANNDIVVTENWLNKLIEVSESDSQIGIVGPLSNSVSGLQLDKNAKYDSIDEMHNYAKSISEKNKNIVFEFPRVAFLCTLIKKGLIDIIGGLDERFTPGNFEDDDFCLRAQLAGYKTVIAKDIFIHHYGSVSFKANGEDVYSQRLKINLDKFISKWGSDPEGIWINGEKIKQRSIEFPINEDKFIEHLRRAFINIDEEDYAMALHNLQIAIDTYENSPRIGFENLKLEDLLNMAGNLAMSKNELDEARIFFEKELEHNPTSSQACFGLGEVFNKAELFEEAKTMFEWSVVNDDQNMNAKVRLTQINKELNLPEKHNSLIESQMQIKE